MTNASDTFAPPSIDVARQHITELLTEFRRATGLLPTYVGILARDGDPKFCTGYLKKDFGFKSYDVVVSRLSALWPEGTPWPASVPRQAPAVISPETLAEFRTRCEKAATPRKGSDAHG